MHTVKTAYSRAGMGVGEATDAALDMKEMGAEDKMQDSLLHM